MKVNFIFLLIILFFQKSFSQNTYPPGCNSGDNYGTGGIFYVHTDSVSHITDTSAVLNGWACSVDQNCSWNRPFRVIAIAAWSTNCNNVCNTNLSVLDTTSIVFENTTCPAWYGDQDNGIFTKIKFKNLIPNTTYYVRYVVGFQFYQGQVPQSVWNHYVIFPNLPNLPYAIGNILTFKTKKAPHPSIQNNIISDNNLFMCEIREYSYAAQHISGSLPTGGNRTYTYKWEKSYDNGNTWNVPQLGNPTAQTYTTGGFSHPGGTAPSYLLRRIVKSGSQRDTSNIVKVTFLPKGYKPLINIYQNSAPNGGISLQIGLGTNGPNNYQVSWADSILSILIPGTPTIASSSATITPLLGLGMNGVTIPMYTNGSNSNHVYYAIINYNNNCPAFRSNFIYVSPPDGDGNIYPVINTSNQYWIMNNLRATKFNDGKTVINNYTFTPTNNTLTPIPTYTANSSWYHTNPANALNYGALYNNYAISANLNVCPIGWKVADETDLTSLINACEGFNSAGTVLESFNDLQNANSITNNYNFNATIGGEGIVKSSGAVQYRGKGSYGKWWGIINNNLVHQGTYFELVKGRSRIIKVTPLPNQSNLQAEYSVRCIRYNTIK